jgi:hypothetical protein
VRDVCSAKATPRFSISSVDFDRLLPQVPDRQAGGEQCDPDDREADQIEAAI